ncbi:MAG TPA: CDP-glucose 4,6-dehydratase [Solirubrobacteraceae bacterium]
MKRAKSDESGSEPSRRRIDPGFWRARRVLLTGHTGFKGAWLSLWLQSLGAEVTGISLGAMPSKPSLYELARVGEGMAASIACDIRDAPTLARELARARPEIVIHMAAQPLVRRSFLAPSETYETNVMGTVNLLEAVRGCASVRALVVVTSDKCYENREQKGGYREGDALGGHDPYSSSKAAAELVTSAYRRSFFSAEGSPRVATARAGNVIGGGDWGEDRLIPDIVRATVAGAPAGAGASLSTAPPADTAGPTDRGEPLRLRNPSAVRPWQHVLCPLSGYLLLAEALCESSDYARAWNFGPTHSDARTVEWVVRRISALWPGGVPWEIDRGEHPHEAPLLELDSKQARERLGWASPLDLEAALRMTVEWYLAWREGRDVRELTLGQVAALGD